MPRFPIFYVSFNSIRVNQYFYFSVILKEKETAIP